MDDSIRVVIVDDSAFIRRAVERMLSDLPGVRIVATAGDGAEAIEAVRRFKPDVVIMDVNMPNVDGLEALRRIMAESPTNVLMLSTQTQEGAEITLTALELGAIDFLDKTVAGMTMDIYGLAPQLREKVVAVATARRREPPAPPPAEPPPPIPARIVASDRFDVVVIGASTGGPRALSEVLCRLPADFPIGIVIAQHMPEGFTNTLAERLDRRCAHTVREARHGDVVEAGLVLLAPGGQQAVVKRRVGRLVMDVSAPPPETMYRPSVDRLFMSAVEAVGGRAIGLVMTGMGDDGARGLRALREAGARTLAESEETAVIYGMPRAASEWAEQMVPLHEIAEALAQVATHGRWRRGTS